ncbi:MAG TPA: signal peptidase I [Armatimonadota bacterium]|nr:signal peptidase I [Armatimonadota bacterium]
MMWINAILAVVGGGIVLALSLRATARAEAAARRQEPGADGDEGQPAGLLIRLAARMSDYLVLWSLSALALIVGTAAETAGAPTSVVWPAVVVGSVGVFLAYFTIPTARRGDTWGKRLAGLTVFGPGGRRLSWWRASLRALTDLICIGLYPYVVGCLDPIWLAVGRRKRALHDVFAGSRVRLVRAPSHYLAWAAASTLPAWFLLSVIVIRPYVMRAYCIPSTAMRPVLAEGDRFMVNLLTYRLRDPRRGEVVVFKAPPQATPDGNARDFVKRIVGLPGDLLEIRSYDGVYVDGVKLPEPYIAPEQTPDYDFGPIRLPAGRYFVLGDRRRDSNDSHRWGTLARSAIKGKVTLRYYPSKRLGVVR